MTRIEISQRLVMVNAASAVGRRLLSVSVLLWAHQYLLGRIDEDEYAIYPVVASVMVFAPLFTSFLASGVGRYAIADYAKGDEDGTTAVVSSIFPLLAVVAAALVGLGVFAAVEIDSFLRISDAYVGDAQVMLVLLVVSFAAQLVTLPFTLGFSIRQRYVLSNAIDVGVELLRLTLLLVLLFTVSTRVLWIVVASVGATLVGLCVRVALSRSMVPALRFERALFDWKRGRELMSFGVWTTFGQLASMIHRGAGPLVLNRFAGAADVTGFHVGAMFDMQIRQMSQAAAGPVQPALTAMHATGDRSRLGNAFLRGGRYALWASLFAACPLVVFRAELVDLYTSGKYPAAAGVMVLLMAVYPLTFSNTMLPKIAVATAHVRSFFLASLGVQLVNLATMLALVAGAGMRALGPALAVFLTTTVSQLFVFWPMGVRMAGIEPGRFARETLLPGLLPGLVASGVWLAIRATVDVASWFELALAFGAGVPVYLGVLYALGMRPDEREGVARLAARFTGRGSRAKA
ncbi:MAG: oligosaccharide flippase family protein [Planctomycetota bacterium]